MILPPPDPSFKWVDLPEGPALICEPLAAIAQHLFTTRSWRLGVDRAREDTDTGWRQVGTAVGVSSDDLMHARQVHGSGIAVGRFGGEPPQADILLARSPELAVAVQVADCVPLLLADPRSGAVAAAHAGWRGLALRVPEIAVRALSEEYGCRPADLVAVAGPSIGACCYEVGQEVRDRFIEGGFAPANVNRWFCDRPARFPANPSMRGIAGGGREGRWFFDGWSAVRDQLAEAGLDDARVFLPALCTASHPEAFCSYRRDGRGAGRTVGVIRAAGSRP